MLRRGRRARAASAGTRPSTSSPGSSRELQAEHGPDAVAVFGGGGLTNEKAYLLGKFARVALGTSQIDYNGRFCMSSAAAAGIKAFGVDRGLPFPVTDLDERRRRAARRGEPGRDDAAVHPAPARRRPDRRRPAAHPDRRAGRACTSRPRRARISRWRWASCTPSSKAATSIRSYVDDRTSGFDEVWRIAARWWPERAERVTGVSAADHAPRRREARRRPQRLHPHRPRHRAARHRHRDGRRLDQPRAGARPARPRGLRLRLPHRAGQRPGRPRARAEGRPAARLPQARRPGRARVRRRRLGRRRRTACPGPAARPPSCSKRSGTDGRPEGADGVRQQRRRLGAALGSVSKIDCPHWTSWSSPTSCCRRPRRSPTSSCPVTQWAEEDGTLTNLEGRVLLRRKAVDAAGRRPVRSGRPPRTRASGWASRKTGSRSTPRRCSRSCGSRPRAASPTTPASATTGCARARPCTGRCRPTTTPARRGCSSTPSPTRTAARGSCRSSTPARPSCRTTSSRCRPPPAACCSTTSRARRRG